MASSVDECGRDQQAAAMKPLSEQMAFYAAYHQDWRNRATHFIGVPAIAFAILIPMAWLDFTFSGVRVSLATAFTFAALLYYVRLDIPLAVVATVIFVPLLATAEWVAVQGVQTGLAVFAVFFVGGWVFQLVGHVWERRRPALADNLMQIFIAPLFLIAEVFFALGLKKALAARVRDLVPNHLPQADGSEAPKTGANIA